MKAVVFHGIGDIRLDDVKEPELKQPTDAIIRLTASAICGTDLHMIRGTMPGMQPGTVLGHEGVGVVEETGKEVRNVQAGDRVVVCSTICCGRCEYCCTGCHSQCDNANPNGAQAGTAFFGGPAATGPIDGLQAEWARIPLADCTLVKVPQDVPDEQAILISDIFPTGYFGADLARIESGDSAVVFGCGPVGLFSVISALELGAGRVFAVDHLPDRLQKARDLGAEPVNFDEVDPVAFLKEATAGAGPQRAIDAVGVDAVHPKSGPAQEKSKSQKSLFKEELKETASDGADGSWGGNWIPGDAPSQVAEWAVKSLAKAGTLAVIGVYPQTMTRFPLGAAMMKNLTLQMGNCPHRKYIPQLIKLVEDERVDPLTVLTQVEPMIDALEAYRSFDRRESGWIKVELQPAMNLTTSPASG